MTLRQDPVPDQRLLMNRGDTVVFTLTLSRPLKGEAWLRSNLGHAETMREELVRQAEHDETPLGRDWYDRPMAPLDETCFRIEVPLHQVGHFEAKCYFLEAGSRTPLWPDGKNTVINVEPARSCAANIIYNAFVRQFGPNKDGRVGPQWRNETIDALDRQKFTVIPPSGTFRDLIDHLDFIIGDLGCTIIQLLPIHPTPTTYARMGRFGSPYAALSFLDVDPALARFDPAATPLEQFGELVDAIHARGARIFLDIAINHTGWAARMHAIHPEWLARDDGGRIEVPGAWGVQWEDLTRLDYAHRGLWHFMADMFLTWCQRGVDGFRCDAGYMIPLPAWRYMVAKVRQQFPDTIFFLEGLGGKISVTRDLLNRANFNWAYSELFQNYDRGQIESYLPGAIDIAHSDGLTVNYAETHDNLRLAARSRRWAAMRTALCALFAPLGAFGFANGVEWFATEKINVHESPSLNWGSEPNLVAAIRRITDLLKHHPCFHDRTRLRLIQADGGNVAVMLRHHEPTDQKVVVVVNLDDATQATASWPAAAMTPMPVAYRDLLTDRTLALAEDGGVIHCRLDPGEVLCLAPADQPFNMPEAGEGSLPARVPRVEHQRMRAKVLDLMVHWNGEQCDHSDIDALAALLAGDPMALCRRLKPSGIEEPGVTPFHWPHDSRRQVMIPPGHLLLVTAPHPFHARLWREQSVIGAEQSLATRDGHHVAFFTMAENHTATIPLRLDLFLYSPGATERAHADLLLLGPPEAFRVNTLWRRTEMPNDRLVWLDTNGRGAMVHTPIRWGELYSRYDALLAANLDPEVPEDRWIMLTRMRAWVVFQGYSQELRNDCLTSFHYDPRGKAAWQFRMPTGQGQSVRLTVSMRMPTGTNALHVTFSRAPANHVPASLPDDQPIRLIVRPDIEDRNFHTTTKAYLGPEEHFPHAVTPMEDGFTFQPDLGRQLRLTASQGRYVHEPEWTYMVHRELEGERGLEADSDLFSPGYIAAEIVGGASQSFTARVITGTENQNHGAECPSGVETEPAGRPEGRVPPEIALRRAMDQFIVKRGAYATVIAGYPWFLDWGRDTLIFCRGMIAAGMTDMAVDILRQFAAFENKGTLPNMIRGNDATNRNTSDAPLWLFVACRDLLRAGHRDFLDMPCGRRRLRDVLSDLGDALCRGAANGIDLDAASGLLYSPAHFTWMDTNHPAGTPREGYPIEIQALWFAALDLLAEIETPEKIPRWRDLAVKVKTSIHDLYFQDRLGYCADCLLGPPGRPARECRPDDALRPNQLFAITLNAITEPDRSQQILRACEKLIVPGAIRSLADQPVETPLAVYHQERLLNDPHNPYQGRYEGDEDTGRKPAYHNGTAWTWVFPSFCEARVMVYGESSRATAHALLATALDHLNTGCLGHIPEILDGDAPHRSRGCDAQAWSVSEVYRVWHMLS